MSTTDTETTEQDTKKKRIKLSDLKTSAEILKFVSPYKWVYLLGLTFLLVSTLSSMLIPFLLSQLIDVIGGESQYFQDLDILMFSLLGLVVFQSLFSFGRVYTFNYVTVHTIADLRRKIYDKVLSLPLPFFEERRVGELISRITSDVSKLEETLSLSLAEFLRQVVTLTIGPAFLFFFSVKLTLLMLAIVPLMVVLLVIFGRFIRNISKEAQDKLANTNIVVDETFHAIQVVKAYTNELFEIGRYSKSIKDVIGVSMRLAVFRGLFISSIIIGLFGSIILILWYGATLKMDGVLTTGELTGFVFYTIFIGGALAGMGDLYAKIQSTLGGTERLLDIIHEDSELTIRPLPNSFKKFEQGKITFNRVSFEYPTRPDVRVLKDIDFTINNGEKVALVGPSGAGKSTITQLMLGFYQASEGVIEINNRPAGEYNLQELRYNMGIVPQDVTLFGGTIGENISYGKPGAAEADIIEAAKKANAWDFISSFPDGLNTIVGERGVKLSGGQKQRVAIARAILKDPTILILDEATSSLDAESEVLVQEALEELMKNRTTIIIAHRLSTIRKADRILVLNDGRIEETGDHDTLAANPDGLYFHLLKLQFEVT